MMKNSKRSLPWVLIVGDVVTYILITLIGFSTHGTLAQESLPRMLATFIPFTAGWFLVAPWLGVFDRAIVNHRTYLARVSLATMLAAPIGAFLRGVWLGSPILPIFVLVMSAVMLGLMIAWRFIHRFVQRNLD
jgi:hypothetical protein